MVLETATDKTVNIRDLTLETKTPKELPFDVDAEVTRDDWEAMVAQVAIWRKEKLINQENPTNYGSLMANMLLLYPERRDQIGILDADYLQIESDLEFRNPDQYVFENARVLYNLKVIFPEEKEDMEGHLSAGSGAFWAELQNKGASYMLYWGTNNYLELSKIAKILAPELYERTTAIKEEDYPKFLEMLSITREIASKSWEYYIEALEDARVVFGERLQQDYQVTGEEWDGIKKEMVAAREAKDWMKFSEMAVAGKIFAAQEVRVTEDGLEIIMPERYEVEEDQLPELKEV